MATSSTYCTHRDVKDVFPNMDDYDTKTPIYGWIKEKDDFDSNSDLWYASNTGLVTQLYIDGREAYKITFPTAQKTQLNAAYSDGASAYVVDSATGIETGDIIKVQNHYSIVGTVAGANVGLGTVAALNTLSVDHADDTPLYLVADLNEHDALSGYWHCYDSDMDMVILALPDDTDPNDLLIESGEDYTTLVTRIMKNASRFLDSRLDANLPRDQFKDKEGNYDYMIVRTTALLSAHFLIKAQEPTNPLAEEFLFEIDKNIDALNSGKTRLSGNVTGDASKGIVREVNAPQGTNGLHIVDTRGHYNGVYDLVKVIITTRGIMGTARFDVYGSSSDNLKDTKIVDARVINGQYQHIGNGLEIRFAGKNSASLATVDDEWEIEAWGRMESLDDNIGNVRSVKMTRGGVGSKRYRRI